MSAGALITYKLQKEVKEMDKAGQAVEARRTWKHLTEHERYIMEYMLKEKKKPKEIAAELGKSLCTIYREIKRGKVELRDSGLKAYEKYCADTGQMKYDELKHGKGRYLKLGNDMEFVRYMENALGEKRLSPAVALCRYKEEFPDGTQVCLATLYSYIHQGLFLNFSDKSLPYHVKKKSKKKGKSKVAKHNVKGTSIEKRPEKVNDRDDFGHWEMDTVYGGKGTSPDCLLVLTERMTRKEEIYHMRNRTGAEVKRILDEVENAIGYEAFKRRYKTITTDNGVEFLDFLEIQSSASVHDLQRTEVYFCHPFCSGERGSNENQNKLIRRWIPKGADISAYVELIPFIQGWINNLPRKLFQWRTSNDMERLALSSV